MASRRQSTTGDQLPPEQAPLDGADYLEDLFARADLRALLGPWLGQLAIEINAGMLRKHSPMLMAAPLLSLSAGLLGPGVRVTPGGSDKASWQEPCYNNVVSCAAPGAGACVGCQ